MSGFRLFSLSLCMTILCVFSSSAGLSAAEDGNMSLKEDDSVAGTGDFSDSNIAKGKNKEISQSTIDSLPPSLRDVWANERQQESRQGRDRRKTLTSRGLTDDIIPAYGVQYITEQRDFSRAEPLMLKVHKFLNDVNIRIMAGDLGRQGPMLTGAKKVKGEKSLKGDVDLVERVPLPEEIRINEFYEALRILREQISYPNLLEREHFNEIAGDLSKAQGLINYDLTEEGVKRIDEQFAAWQVLIEVARLRAIEAYTDELLQKEENAKWDRTKARREAESADIEFKLPPLPMSATALQDARGDLHRMHEVRNPAAQKNAKAREREEAKKEEEAPAIIEVTPAEEEAVEEEAVVEEKAEEMEEVVVEEKKEEVKELDVEVEDFDIEEDDKKTEMKKEPEKKAENKEDDFEFEDEFEFE